MRRTGLTAVEAIVTAALVAALALPTWALFVGGRRAAFKSKLAYLCALVAREEIEDLHVRTHLIDGEPWTLKHPWVPVKGPVLARLGELDPEPGGPAYADEQARIFTRLEVFPPVGSAWPAVLWVRWQRHGEDPAALAAIEDPGLSRFDFVIVKPRAGGR